MADVLLSLHDFVRAFEPEMLRILHRDTAWWVRSGKHVLRRPCGSTAFSSVEEAMGVLAGVGIRCALVEWDGMRPIEDRGRTLSDAHVDDKPPQSLF
jgi:hypothetical protein